MSHAMQGHPRQTGHSGVLMKRGPLEKGMANHFSILALRIHEYEKAKRYNTERLLRKPKARFLTTAVGQLSNKKLV